jgi:hypothetical protein
MSEKTCKQDINAGIQSLKDLGIEYYNIFINNKGYYTVRTTRKNIKPFYFTRISLHKILYAYSSKTTFTPFKSTHHICGDKLCLNPNHLIGNIDERTHTVLNFVTDSINEKGFIGQKEKEILIRLNYLKEYDEVF